VCGPTLVVRSQVWRLSVPMVAFEPLSQLTSVQAVTIMSLIDPGYLKVHDLAQ
jgi:hypothetical protein